MRSGALAHCRLCPWRFVVIFMLEERLGVDITTQTLQRPTSSFALLIMFKTGRIAKFISTSASHRRTKSEPTTSRAFTTHRAYRLRMLEIFLSPRGYSSHRLWAIIFYFPSPDWLCAGNRAPLPIPGSPFRRKVRIVDRYLGTGLYTL